MKLSVEARGPNVLVRTVSTTNTLSITLSGPYWNLGKYLLQLFKLDHEIVKL